MFRVFAIVGVIFFTLAGISQTREAELPRELWVQANYALLNQDYNEALALYQRVLRHCQRRNDVTGKVNALEAIALVHKKLEKFSRADEYCQQAIATGQATYRSYFLLAQIAYENRQNVREARRYCSAGLRRFPNNSDLRKYSSRLGRSTDGQESGSEDDSRRFLSALEMEVVRQTNMARANPKEFAKHLENLRKYYSGSLLKVPGRVPVRTNEGVKAVDEAIRYLKKVNPVPILSVSQGMSKAASDHVADQSKSGETGHRGGDGSEPFERMERYGSWQGLSGENIAYGDDDARMIVMQLIIDDGVPSRGHRDNIFNPEFRVTGVAFGSHPAYRNMCVITYASGFKEGKQK